MDAAAQLWRTKGSEQIASLRSATGRMIAGWLRRGRSKRPKGSGERSGTKGQRSSTKGQPSGTKGQPSGTKGQPSSTKGRPSGTGKPQTPSAEEELAEQQRRQVARILAASDHYDVLGLREDANATAVKTAFRRLARLVHPDKTQVAEAPRAFLLLQEAQATLSDPAKRREFELQRQGIPTHAQAHAWGAPHAQAQAWGAPHAQAQAWGAQSWGGPQQGDAGWRYTSPYQRDFGQGFAPNQRDFGQQRYAPQQEYSSFQAFYSPPYY